LEAIQQKSKDRQLVKGESFLSEGIVSREIGFLNKGVLRVYHIHDGKEITKYFNTTTRNPFVASFKSFLTEKPGEEWVVALEDCEIQIVSKTTLEQLYTQYHPIERLGRKLAEYNYLLSLERIESLQYQSATDRYESFLKLYPDLINRIPQHYIASYLGVTPESLSRVRKTKHG